MACAALSHAQRVSVTSRSFHAQGIHMTSRMPLARTCALALATALIALLAAHTARAATPTVHFTAAGDYQMNANTQAVLDTVVRQAPRFHLALGDLSYGRTGDEHLWCDMVTATVGPTFPFELVTGNHESSGANGSIEAFAKCLPNRLPGLVGTYGRQWYVDVPADKPVMRIIMASPNIVFPEGRQTYAKGTPEYTWLSDAIDGAHARNDKWVVAGMHYPCLGIGKYGCTLGADVFNLLVEKKVDLVLNGHEHNYSRTYQLGYGVGCEGPAQLHNTSYDADCVRDRDGQVTPGAGTVFATVGTGGTTLRDLVWADPEAPYFAAASGLNASPSWGVLDIQASSTHLKARFVPAVGSFQDTITIGDPDASEPSGGGSGGGAAAVDRDGDGVRDARDLCPAAAGPPTRRGCPRIVSGTSLRDVLIGSRFAERISGGAGNDIIRGRAGNDVINGNRGLDGLSGGAGDDRLVGGPGRDLVWGCAGNDTILTRDGGRDVIYCGAGIDTVIADRFDTLRGCEHVRR